MLKLQIMTTHRTSITHLMVGMKWKKEQWTLKQQQKEWAMKCIMDVGIQRTSKLISVLYTGNVTDFEIL